ncbi:MAG: zf-TFIIB domain-containing protein [Chloroflexota bacterium]|nr:zf-TFIIB domain-containing protein [Chloroflexota bacterium]
MKCPVCTTTELKMTERQGVEIDYCPQCRGVWLDRGELDKIVERATAYEEQTALPVPSERKRQEFYDHYEYDDDDHYRHDDRRYPQGKRKRSFLGEMFDIFD